MEVNDLKSEINNIKEYCATHDRKIIELQFRVAIISKIMKENELKENELMAEDSFKEKEYIEESVLENIEDNYNLLIINKILYQKWYIIILLVVQNEFTIENAIALVDSGAFMNCI